MRYKAFWRDREGVSPVIAVVLLVAMTVVLVSVLYFTVSGMVERTQTTPRVAFHFDESTTITGKYTGFVVSISEEIKLTDVSLTLVDAETTDTDLINPLEDNGMAQAGAAGAEINVSFDDIGMLGQLDSSDVFYVEGATVGDKIIFSYIPSDDLLSDPWVVEY